MASKKWITTEPRMEKLFEFICAYYAEHLYAPSRREMGDELGTSTSVINRYLDMLVKAGKIEMDEAIARGIRIIDSPVSLVLYLCADDPKCPSFSRKAGVACPVHHHPLVKTIFSMPLTERK